MRFWFKISICQNGAQKTLSEFPDNGWKVGSIDSLLERIHKTDTIVRQAGSGIDRVRRVAVSQVDKPKRHRSAREISHETAILCSSVYRIIHRDLQLKCFKQRRAQLLSEANRISSHSLIRDKQPYRLQ